MPEDMKYRDAPAVFDETHGVTQLINSRMTRGFTILDGLPGRFRLVAGVGDGAQAVVCAHGQRDMAGRDGPRHPGNVFADVQYMN
jgi:type IV secretion system protein VirB9